MAFRGITKLNLLLNEEGFKDCKEAEKNIPENVDVLSCFSVYYHNIHKYNEAIVYADKVVKLSPSKENYYIQGVILKELERYEDSLKSFDKSIELGNESSDVFYLKAGSYKEQKNYKASLEELNKAILHSKKDNYRLYSFRGSIKWDLDDFEGALIDFNTALKIDPTCHVAHSNKCEVLEILNNLEEALLSCNEAIKLKPDYPNSYQNKARIHKKQNHYDLALQDAQKAKELYEKHLPIQKDSDYYSLETFIKSVSK